MKRSSPVEGFHERKWQVINEWIAKGRSIHEITDYMGMRRQYIYRDVNWSLGRLARFCAITGESADWMLGLTRERRRRWINTLPS